MEPRPKQRLDRGRTARRRTAEASVPWIKRSILGHHNRYPHTTTSADLEAFLTHLAVEPRVTASTPTPAHRAVLVRYPTSRSTPCAHNATRRPTVSTTAAARMGIGRLAGTPPGMAPWRSGSGLRRLPRGAASPTWMSPTGSALGATAQACRSGAPGGPPA
jgi:hypothetical protein